MIWVTGRAKQELRKILTTHIDHPEVALRLTASESDKLALIIDVEKPGDKVVGHEGYKVLLVEHDLASSLERHTLAFENKKFIIAEGPLSGFNKNEVTFNG